MANWTVPLWVVVEADNSMEAYEKAEEMADRIGVISHGEIILVQDKNELMKKLGKKQLTLQLHESIEQIPAALSEYGLELSEDGDELTHRHGIAFRDNDLE